VVTQAAGLLDRVLKDLLCVGGKFDLDLFSTGRRAHAFDNLANATRFQSKFAEHSAGDAALFFHQSEKQVLGSDASLMTPLSLLVRQAQDPPGALGEAFHTSHGVRHS
jgi:hypothetical protein